MHCNGPNKRHYRKEEQGRTIYPIKYQNTSQLQITKCISSEKVA